MNIIEPSVDILACPSEAECLKLLEIAGKTCYRSELSAEPEKFVKNIIKRGHLSVIEHVNVTVQIICDRGIMAELTRHRLASFSVESSRYCNYSNNKFNKQITLIKPFYWKEDSHEYRLWKLTMETIEEAYMALLKSKATPEQARSVLPNSLATRIIMTANLREWLHIIKLRCSDQAHPQMREVMHLAREIMQDQLPSIFGEYNADGNNVPLKNIFCPACGYYCLGKGGNTCIGMSLKEEP